MNESIQKVIALLHEKGLSDEEIATLCEDVMIHAYEDFVDESKMLLTEDDLQLIDGLSDTNGAAELMRIYQMRTNNDPQERMQHFIQIRADLLMQEYSTDKTEQESNDSDSKLN